MKKIVYCLDNFFEQVYAEKKNLTVTHLPELQPETPLEIKLLFRELKNSHKEHIEKSSYFRYGHFFFFPNEMKKKKLNQISHWEYPTCDWFVETDHHLYCL